MHQDIKTFSDAWAIDPAGQLQVDFRMQRHGRTQSRVSLNQYVLDWDVATIHVGLFESILLEIDLLDFDEGSSGIEIVDFRVNGLEVLPLYQHMASRPTNYIDQKGKWIFAIPGPFYTWYHNTSGQGWIA
jgi:hypothetical protein